MSGRQNSRKVITEPLKTKPAKVSSKIELTGNYSVVSNDVKGVHISKKIKSNETITEIKNVLLTFSFRSSRKP